MIKRPLHIILRLILVMMPVLLALSHSRANGVDTVYAGQSTVLAVVEDTGIAYYWELYNDVDGLNLAEVPGNCPPAEAYFVGGVNTGDSVEVMWMVPGTYFFKVTANDSCTNNLKVGKVVVLEELSNAVLLQPDPVCEGDTALLTVLITGGSGPWSITFTDGISTWVIDDINESPHTFQLIPTPPAAGSYDYWITSVTGGGGGVNNTTGDPVILIVLPKPVTSPIYRYEP